MENIGTKIKELRLLKGLTQEDLAEKTGLSVRTIQRIESGEVDPRTFTLNALAEALEVDIKELIGNKLSPSKSFLDDDYTWVIFLHFSGIFVLVLPPIIIWLIKRNQIPEYEQHFKDVINFQFSMFIYLMISVILLIIIIGLPMLIFLSLFSTVVIVLNTIKVMNREVYHYPFCLKIIK